MTTQGILGLWHDCAPGKEELLDRWLQGEHLAERVAVPGFRSGRRYEAIEAPRQFMTIYETDDPQVLVSAAYRARLNDPTPLTREIMSGVMRNMSRTICRREWRLGEARGATALTVPLAAATADEAAMLGEAAKRLPGIVRVELWLAELSMMPAPSGEEKLRGGDERIEACLLAEALRESALRTAADLLGRRLTGGGAGMGLYRLLCLLEASAGEGA